MTVTVTKGQRSALRLVRKYHWQRWLQRPIGAFLVSLIGEKSTTREMMRKTGVDAEYFITIFQRGAWYESTEVRQKFVREIRRSLRRGVTISEIVRRCEKLGRQAEDIIRRMNEDPIVQPFEKLKIFRDIQFQVNAYTWLTYGLEDILRDRVAEIVPGYSRMTEDEFIRTVSVPARPTAHMKFEKELARRTPLAEVHRKFAWLKTRDGFSTGFTLRELRLGREKVRRQHRQQLSVPRVAPQLRPLVKDIQEIVYFRNLRGDIRAHLIYLMRPILKTVARQLGIKFNDLSQVGIHDLLSGNPRRYPMSTTFFISRGVMTAFRQPIIVDEIVKEKTEVHGVIAQTGVVRGRVAIVTSTKDLVKVKSGDVLVTQQTFPAYILALRRAIAFVTDEGGITSHAAVIAREMKKSCVIGTKIATQVFKDGDMVEVDAVKGRVKLLFRNQKRATTRQGIVRKL